MSHSEDLRALADAALLLQQQGDDRQAALLWRQCLKLAPDHRDWRKWSVHHARALFNLGRQARAYALLRRLGRLCPDKLDGPANLALLYQKAGAHDLAAPVWRDVLSRFPNSADRRWLLASAAYSLIDLGEYDTAQQLCEEAIAAFPQAVGGYAALAVVWERRAAWEKAHETLQTALGLVQGDDRISLIVSQSRILAEMGASANGEALLQVELDRSPGNVRLLKAAAELARTQGPTDEALRRWNICIATCPDAPDGYLGMAAMLRATDHPVGARVLLREACERFPGLPTVWQALAEACVQLREMEDARRAWQHAERLSPLSVYRLWAHCAFLGACGARAEAEALLARRHASGRVLWRGRYEYAKAARELGSALDCLAQLRAASPEDASLAMAEAEIRCWRQDDGDLERAAGILQGLLDVSPAGVRAKVLRARILVLLGEPGEAEAHIATIAESEQRQVVAEARLWADAHHAEWQGVATRWTALERRFFLPALHLPAADLRLVGTRFTPPAQGGILGVSIVRNEMPRLDGFLAHHRRLGVSGFVIIDNGSQDGTVEFLAAQADVRLYAADGSFAQSRYGMRWLNQIIDMHGNGWVLYADADERLVFPGSETRSLTSFTNYLAARNEQVVAGVMLDMFPVDGAYIWFDPPTLRPSMNCPFLEAAGGVRRRLFGTTVTLSKAPLIHAAAGVRYLGSHHTTPAPTSSVTAAMLHYHLGYLFDENQQVRMADEAARAQHSDHAVDRRRMLAMVRGLSAVEIKGPKSLMYQGTAQLLEHGLLSTTGAFEAASQACDWRAAPGPPWGRN